MKKKIKLLALLFLMGISTNAQIKKPTLDTKNAGTITKNQVQGLSLPNIDKLNANDVKKLQIPTVSITEIQKNAKAITKWEISPLRPKYASLELDGYYGEYSPKGWRLEPRPQFEGPDFKGFGLSALRLGLRVSNGEEYRIKIKLKKTMNNWYEGKQIMAAVFSNTYAKYPIDSRNNEILLAFTANRSGEQRLHIGNIINASGRLFPYTIEKVTVDKISR